MKKLAIRTLKKQMNYLTKKLNTANLPPKIRPQLVKEHVNTQTQLSAALLERQKIFEESKACKQQQNIPEKSIRKQTLEFVQKMKLLKSQNAKGHDISTSVYNYIVGNGNMAAQGRRMRLLAKYRAIEIDKHGNIQLGKELS